MKTLLTSTFTLGILLSITPASAQLLGGGGGLMGGGGLGGALGGINSSMGGAGGLTGTLSGAGSIDRSIDRRSGRVAANGSGSGSTSGSAAGSSTTLGRTASGALSGSGSASGSGSIAADTVGTDDVRGVVGSGRNMVSSVGNKADNTVVATRDRAGMAVSNARNRVTDATGTLGNAANGSAGGAGSGQGTLSVNQLALAGSGAANGAGMFSVNPGMVVQDSHGRAIGTVQSVRTRANGVVDTVLVESGDRVASLPATNFSGSGEVLTSTMTKGELKKEAKAQSAE